MGVMLKVKQIEPPLREDDDEYEQPDGIAQRLKNPLHLRREGQRGSGRVGRREHRSNATTR
eukprot:5198929-Prymnesium_polylepis.1